MNRPSAAWRPENRKMDKPEKVRILVVDDDRDIAEVVRAALTDEGTSWSAMPCSGSDAA